MHAPTPRSLGALALALCLAPAHAQIAPTAGHWEAHPVASGSHANPTAHPVTVFQTVIALDATIPWMRIHYAAAELGPGSALRVTSLVDGDQQTLDRKHLTQWQHATAFFNGHLALVELIAGPGTAKNSFRIEKVWAGDPLGGAPAPETVCGGTDDRVPSNHPAVGRLLESGLGGGCTAWIAAEPNTGDDRCHLAAGHCFPASAVLQFDVPASNANCNLAHPPAARQYAVDTTRLLFRSGGVGDDYAVFRCFPNPQTGLTTFQAQGSAIALANTIPGPGATLRVTGFGLDGSDRNGASGGNASCGCTGQGGARNQTQQSHEGPLTAVVGTRGEHQVDTCGGNSGSPMLNVATGQAIGIHTHGGCSDPVLGTSNAGTLLSNSGLQRAIQLVCHGQGIPGDECAGALPLADGPNGPYSNQGATTSQPAWPCGQGGSDVWFTYTASCTAAATIATCGSALDTVLQVFSGTCAAPTSLGCNDDACGTQSSVTFAAVQGATYVVRVGGAAGVQGTFGIQVTCGGGGGPANDECVGAVVVANGINGPYDSSSASTSFPSWPCANGGNDLWFQYQAPCTGTATFDTCVGSSFDTAIEVFDGPCTNLNPLACNDDACGLQSIATVNVTQGTTYTLRVGGFGSATGTFSLRVSCSPGGGMGPDDCTGAVPVLDGANGPFLTTGATTSPPPWPCALGGSDVWFSYTASCTGQITVDTCSGLTGYDTAMQAFSGTCANLVPLVCNDDACGLSSSITWNGQGGQTYLIRVGGFNGQTGQFGLNVRCSGPLTNDECANARVIGLGANGPFSNIGATTSAPAWPCANGGNDVWFRYTAACGGNLQIDTCGATFDSALQVFAGTCGALTPVACNDDACGLQSVVVFPQTAGTTYLIRVGGFSGAQGTFPLQLSTGGSGGQFATSRTGCGANGLTASGAPVLGGQVTYTMNGSSGTPLLWIGLPLRTPLCPIQGCQLGATFEVILGGQTSVSGTLPCDNALVGATFSVQGGSVGATGGCPPGSPLPIGITVTDTIDTTIG